MNVPFHEDTDSTIYLEEPGQPNPGARREGVVNSVLFHFLSRILVGGSVSVWVGVKRGRIHDSLVVHQLVTLVIGKSKELVLFGITYNLVAFDDLRFTRFLEWLLDFVQHVLTHDVIIQLGFAFAIEAKAPDFAFHVTILGLVPIILGTARHEFHDVIIGVQFTRKLAEVIAQDRVGLPSSSR